MADIIDFKKNKVTKKNNKSVDYLVNASKLYDEVSLSLLYDGVDITEVAGIMANRLGELVRLAGTEGFDKERFKGMLYNIIHDRTYLGEER